ncbi:type II secretion system F family protein [Paraburkholderia lycopersici]|uniref:Tight adherence protein C n=1 Tax=Paraburkholderia lycopersici TaxID=416944 RepID=A0A1G7BHV2_9BURK|nr:type II secretion system F family protein [Paraburkholderia lycopersici]SDE25825.1 tight adherence protein C [Paraburkholderia lycopersici]
MNAERIAVLALLLAALGFTLFAVLACMHIVAARRTERTLKARFGAPRTPPAAGARDAVGAPPATPAKGSTAVASNDSAERATGFPGFVDALAATGARWLDTSAGRLIVADEDRRVIDQCGFVGSRARGFFLMARLGCAIAFSVVFAWLVVAHGSGRYGAAYVCGGALAGFMVPKICLRRKARGRIEAVASELPMLVDLLRLLQGVGLSLDQSLQVMINEFRRVLPVLAGEMEIAQQQFVAGRTREQSLQRMASIFDNEDLRTVIRLLVQVDRHGGAVQEPLKQFGERLREVRRAALREHIGRLTVKMTGVMIVTLLPALLIVTAGPGMIAVMHSLLSLHHEPGMNRGYGGAL